MELEPHPSLRPDMAGRPVYLAIALNARGRLTLKPQNLLLNLPWGAGERP
jgi:hypothetical protein